MNVWEAPNAENYLTTYTYDTLDNLTNVNQGGQLRSFAYSSLKRLTSATNPESGTTTYTYDNNGNLLTKTDARPLTTMFSYDGLNRVTTKSYSQYLSGTTNVNYYYDGAPNGKGKFSYNVSYNTEANGTLIYNYDQINSYDQLGRPTIKTQNFLVNQGGYTWKPYVTSATYNLAGAMTSETYPSGRTVNYAYDDAGRTTSFTGYLGDGAFRSYATAMTYLPAGQLVKETFGTTTPLYQNFHYNVRQQLYDVRVGTNGADPLSWDRGALEFLYGSAGWGDSNADNNGNITRSDHWIPDASGNWSSTTYDYYGYDSLNRVASTTEYTNSSSNTNVTFKYSQQFDYDRYGNRTINQANTTTSPDINKKLFTVNTANNRLGVPGGQTGAMAYDNVGNLISDTYTNPSAGGAMEYDADNHMTAAVNGSHKYRYNADGKRVRRIIAGQGEFWMVYGIGGELVAEYNASTGIPAQTSPSKEYGYRNGKLLIVAEGSTPKWLIQDHLGSTRMEIGQGGNIGDVTRHDYLPFGEELAGTVRSGNGYAIGNTKQKFTGHERDTETGLDFMQARYYANVQGRFTSPDNPFADQSEDDPQSWNLYTYAHNNPLAWIDPTGQFAQKKECFDNGACLNPATGQFELPGEPSGGIPLVITVRPDAFTDILAEQLIQEEQMRRRMDQVSKTDFDFSGGGIVRVGIKKGGAKLLPRILKGLRIAKAVNLPAWKTIAIDIKHILSGHTLGGSRVSSLKDLFPSHMSEAQIEKAVREAYRYGEKVSSQGERVMIQGEAAGLKIEMWVNTVTKTIETAYPVF